MALEKLTIRCRENGPLVVPAKLVRIIDHLGNEFPIPEGKENVALCRCGASKVKPFCDGSHRACGFAAVDVAPAPPQA
jgi:CDGSH-type Zn-finger protein